MPETTNNLTWIILGLLIAAVVIAVVLLKFPGLTTQITDFLTKMVGQAGDKITDSLNAANATPK